MEEHAAKQVADGAGVSLAGTIGLGEVRSVRERVGDAVRERKEVRLDLSRVESLDGGVAAILVALRTEARSRGVSIVFEGARGRVRSLLDAYEARGETPRPKPAPAGRGALDEVGFATVKIARGIQGSLAFVGESTAAFAAALARPASVRWRETFKLAEQVGANGLPVVALVSVLVGFIIAFQSASELKKYGADLMVADLISLTITREMGPLMACLITVARSGSAYTAELGTMKVNEEIDAIRALGLSPVRFLVVPRVLAMVAVVPLLAVFADVLGILGGLLVALSRLELTSRSYFIECQAALAPRDIILGVAKSVTFALAASVIACQRGLSTRGGAEGVGRATTNAVVVMIVAVIGLDAVFAFFTNLFHL